jgi:hypothetical protein
MYYNYAEDIAVGAMLSSLGRSPNYVSVEDQYINHPDCQSTYWPGAFRDDLILIHCLKTVVRKADAIHFFLGSKDHGRERGQA